MTSLTTPFNIESPRGLSSHVNAPPTSTLKGREGKSFVILPEIIECQYYIIMSIVTATKKEGRNKRLYSRFGIKMQTQNIIITINQVPGILAEFTMMI